MKLGNIGSLIIIATLVIFGISFENSYAEKTIPIEIKYTNGDIADFSAMKIIVYQDFDKIPIVEKKLNSNPENITIEDNHRYKIEVYANGMYADVGYIVPNDNSDKLDITIPLSGGVNFEVYYKDGTTPINNVNVILKSQDNETWGNAITNDQGETRRFWIQSTVQQENYYMADVYMGDLFLTSHFPITVSPGIAFTEKIITNIPEVVDDLITINLFAGAKKITSSDENYKVTISQIESDEKITSNLDFRGNAHFSNLISGTYSVKITSDTITENILWSETKIHVIGDLNEFNIFKNTDIDLEENELFNSCNCVAFRLDDVQDYWLADTQKEIIDLFAEKNIPLSIGVIGSKIGSDENITTMIKDNLEEDNIEIVNHSWDNDILMDVSIDIQKEKIIKTNEKIYELFGTTPNIFVPPENLYDENTVNILMNNNFTHLVSHIDDIDDTFIINNLFYNIPAITETGDLVDGIHWQLRNNDYIIDKVSESLNERGYSIVMIHPQEYALNDNGEYDIPNSESLDDLSTLIDELVQLDARIIKVSEIKPTKIIIAEDSEKQENEIDSCNCVAFRLDDVQDYWLNDVQIKIMETFSENNTPLTIGILANAFGNDQKITKFVKENMIENGGNIEVATKGIGLTPYTNYNKIEQSENLKESLDEIEIHLDVRAKIFIPPDNKFNSDTLDVLEENNITHISSSLINGDSPPFEFKNQKIYRFPLITTTGEYNPTENIFEGIPSQQTLSESIQGISNYGYSVISLHPQEYSIIQNSTYTNSINEKQINELIKLIDEFTNQGYKIVPLGNINSNLIVSVPEWIKNNAGWWADGSIDDKTFVQGIEYLVKNGIIAY